MATTSSYSDKEFGANFLENIVDWITEHFSADEIYTPTGIKEAVANLNWDPDDIFTEIELETWLLDNDWVKEE